MSKAAKIEQLKKQVHDLMITVPQDQEPGAFYGLRLAWESLYLAYYGATDNTEGIREKLYSVELALDDFENFVLSAEAEAK